jgi:hypothetical protein
MGWGGIGGTGCILKAAASPISVAMIALREVIRAAVIVAAACIFAASTVPSYCFVFLLFFFTVFITVGMSFFIFLYKISANRVF